MKLCRGGNTIMTACAKYEKKSIELSCKGDSNDLRVGGVLVDGKGKIIETTFAGEMKNRTWVETLLRKIQKSKLTYAYSLYLTINTISIESSFDLLKLLDVIRIENIYIGLPDPYLHKYIEEDPVIKYCQVKRYSYESQREILQINESFYLNSKQSIKYNVYFSENRISQLIMKKLMEYGINISVEELNKNKDIDKLAKLIYKKSRITFSKAAELAKKVIAEAFEYKYGMYNYTYDARLINSDWREVYISILEKLDYEKLSTTKVINVGVGGGQEAYELFCDYNYITFVDIAISGLNKLQKKYPTSKCIVADAADLSTIKDNSFDMYISLRTYNSSFFDIRGAVGEAYRILKPNSIIVISVANGFYCSDYSTIIPGLIIPGTNFIDIYRGMDIIKMIEQEFLQYGFSKIHIVPTMTEIFIAAIRN